MFEGPEDHSRDVLGLPHLDLLGSLRSNARISGTLSKRRIGDSLRGFENDLLQQGNIVFVICETIALIPTSWFECGDFGGSWTKQKVRGNLGEAVTSLVLDHRVGVIHLMVSEHPDEVVCSGRSSGVRTLPRAGHGSWEALLSPREHHLGPMPNGSAMLLFKELPRPSGLCWSYCGVSFLHWKAVRMPRRGLQFTSGGLITRSSHHGLMTEDSARRNQPTCCCRVRDTNGGSTHSTQRHGDGGTEG